MGPPTRPLRADSSSQLKICAWASVPLTGQLTFAIVSCNRHRHQNRIKDDVLAHWHHFNTVISAFLPFLMTWTGLQCGQLCANNWAAPCDEDLRVKNVFATELISIASLTKSKNNSIQFLKIKNTNGWKNWKLVYILDWWCWNPFAICQCPCSFRRLVERGKRLCDYAQLLASSDPLGETKCPDRRQFLHWEQDPISIFKWLS